MNINNIFNLFNNEHEQPEDEYSLLIDFSEHPLYWIGGFNKTLNNHSVFKLYTKKIFNDISSQVDMNEIERIGEQMVFNKAWDYIKSIKLDNQFHLDCISDKASEQFLGNLIFAIKHFEQLEEYEKCALLKKIEEKVKYFLS